MLQLLYLMSITVIIYLIKYTIAVSLNYMLAKRNIFYFPMNFIDLLISQLIIVKY